MEEELKKKIFELIQIRDDRNSSFKDFFESCKRENTLFLLIFLLCKKKKKF